MSGMNGNGKGHGGVIPFRADVPIVGQPFQVKGWSSTVLITCQCVPHGEPVMLVGQAPGQCPRCQRAFVVVAVTFDAATNKLQVGVGLVQQQAPAAAPPAESGS